MRVTTAFNKILGLSGASVVSVAFTAEGIVVGLGRRCRRLACPWRVLHPWDVRPLQAAMRARPEVCRLSNPTSTIEKGSSVENSGTIGVGRQQVVHAVQHAAPVRRPSLDGEPR